MIIIPMIIRYSVWQRRLTTPIVPSRGPILFQDFYFSGVHVYRTIWLLKQGNCRKFVTPPVALILISLMCRDYALRQLLTVCSSCIAASFLARLVLLVAFSLLSFDFTNCLLVSRFSFIICANNCNGVFAFCDHQSDRRVAFSRSHESCRLR